MEEWLNIVPYNYKDMYFMNVANLWKQQNFCPLKISSYAVLLL